MKGNGDVKTSVIIPIYNTEDYLDECIQSVLNQTQKEIEIILVNDGSTDRSRQIIDDYARRYDNIIAIHQENKKLGAARNSGYKKARGKYIYFLDSDDYLSEDMLDKCYTYAEEKEAEFIFFDSYLFEEENGVNSIIPDTVYDRTQKGISTTVFAGKVYWQKYYKLGGVITCAQMTYIRRDYFERYNLLFEEGIFYEDNDWIARMYVNAERTCYFPEKLYYRRIRTGSIMQSTYTATHFNSAVVMFWKLIQLSIQTNDLQSKKMYEDVLSSFCTLFRKMVLEIERELVLNDLLKLLEDLRSRDLELSSFGTKTYSRILLLALAISPEMFFSDKLEALIRNNYKLEQFINIGIYGMGKMCDGIFEWYERREIPINANITFIATEASVELYRGYIVGTVTQLANRKFDYIIIASVKYADEMKKQLEQNHVTSEAVFVTIGSLGDI